MRRTQALTLRAGAAGLLALLAACSQPEPCACSVAPISDSLMPVGVASPQEPGQGTVRPSTLVEGETRITDIVWDEWGAENITARGTIDGRRALRGPRPLRGTHLWDVCRVRQGRDDHAEDVRRPAVHAWLTDVDGLPDDVRHSDRQGTAGEGTQDALVRLAGQGS